MNTIFEQVSKGHALPENSNANEEYLAPCRICGLHSYNTGLTALDFAVANNRVESIVQLAARRARFRYIPCFKLLLFLSLFSSLCVTLSVLVQHIS